MGRPPDIDGSVIGQQETAPAEPGANRHRNTMSGCRAGDGFDARCQRSRKPDAQPPHPELTASLVKPELVSEGFEGEHKRDRTELLHELAAGPR
jgi:hypothetical protein